MPRRTRRKSREPRCSAIERRPLWPATPPPVLIRTLPAARSSSSWHDHDPAERQLVEADGRGDRLAGQVHVGLRLLQQDPLAPRRPRSIRPEKRLRQGPKPWLSRDRVDRHEADVVAMAGIAGTGIAEPDQQQHEPRGGAAPAGSSLAGSSSASAPRPPRRFGRFGLGLRRLLGDHRRRRDGGDVKSRSVIVGRTPSGSAMWLMCTLSPMSKPLQVDASSRRDRVGRADQLDLAADDVEHAAALEAGRDVLVDERTCTSTVIVAPPETRTKSAWIGSSVTGWSWTSRGSTRDRLAVDLERDKRAEEARDWPSSRRSARASSETICWSLLSP